MVTYCDTESIVMYVVSQSTWGGVGRRESQDKLTGEAPLRQPAGVPGRVLGRAVSTR